jgi:hypothetical protein
MPKGGRMMMIYYSYGYDEWTTQTNDKHKDVERRR